MHPLPRFARLVADGGPLEELVACIGVAFEPSASLAGVSRAIDGLARACPASFDGVMGLFATVLRGDVEHYHDRRNSFLHSVLQRGQGMPITLSVVAMCVGERVGVAIEGASLPGHFVVRDVASGRVGDPFNNGRIVAGPTSAAYTPAAIAARILNNLERPLLERQRRDELATLARLRESMPDFEGEANRYRAWMRRWN